MWENEQFAALIAKERIQNATRRAEQTRILRSARVPRRPLRVRLGTALAQLGHWMMGQRWPDPERPAEYGPLQS
jgi:hypothetical protein